MPKNALIISAATILFIYLWFLISKSPEEIFEEQMRSHVDDLNEYQHKRVRPYVSEALKKRILQSGFTLERASMMVHQRDLQAGFQYAFLSTPLFV
ncbi:MAG: hypothetical protein AAFY98_03010 [Verrucomicrobiota bacterium]